MLCDRCGKETAGAICSMFNTETICFDCKDKEKEHPLYEEASRVEGEAVLRGEYNHPGIGLPEELRRLKLWHDDVRPPPDKSWDLWARTNEAAKDFLKSGRVTECSLDHDMGLHGLEIPDDPDELIDMIHLVGPAAETGLDLVHWMIEEGCVPDIVRIHSWNPEGARNMAARLNYCGYSCIVDPYKVPT